jgi:hypothetical protein
MTHPLHPSHLSFSDLSLKKFHTQKNMALIPKRNPDFDTELLTK